MTYHAEGEARAQALLKELTAQGYEVEQAPNREWLKVFSTEGNAVYNEWVSPDEDITFLNLAENAVKELGEPTTQLEQEFLTDNIIDEQEFLTDDSIDDGQEILSDNTVEDNVDEFDNINEE